MSKKEKVMAILFLVLLFVVVGGAIFLYKFQDRLPDEVGYVLGVIAFSVMAIVGCIDFIKSIILAATKKSIDTITVRGIIVDHILRSDVEPGRSWFPVYEYYADGEIRRFRSNLASGRTGKRALGAEVKIVHNTVTGEAFCPSDVKNVKWISFVFMIMGSGIVAVLILKLMGRI